MADQIFRNFINGEFVDGAGGETYDVLDPSTGETYAQAVLSREEDVDRAYAAAEAAFESWGSTTPRERSEALLKIGESPVDGGLDRGELAAWTIVSSIVLNLDETVTKN